MPATPIPPAATLPVTIGLPRTGALGRALGDRAVGLLDRACGLDQIDALYRRVLAAGPLPAGPDGVRTFCRRVLADLKVRTAVAPEDLARVPRKGPLLVVANHPFGGLDGIALAAVLSEVRGDVKILANYLLGRIPEMRQMLLSVDPFHGDGSVRRNTGPMRDSLRWLRDGHVLAVFPAGEVGHLTMKNLTGDEGAVTDPAWDDTVGRLAMRAGAPVLPVYFSGRNGPLFQAAGLVHPLLRTALLPRALLGKRRSTVALRVGSIVPANRLARFGSDRDVTDYLRRRTFMLRHGAPRPSIPGVVAADQDNGRSALARLTAGVARAAKGFLPARGASSPAAAEPIVPAADPALMAAEIAALPAGAVLLEHDDMVVLHAKAAEARHVLREIGRLREVTFRQVGEGTGKSIDLDTFDYDYRHLFIWNRAAREVVGAYRLGQTDLLIPAKGRQGLYTSTLFNYKAGLLDRLNPALEMGRSFVRPEYQKSYAPLLLLWKGIGHYLVQNPQYRYLFGPVSISNSYQTVSRQLMVRFLTMHHAMPAGEALATPKNPFKPGRPGRGLGGRLAAKLGRGGNADGVSRLLQDDDDVSSLIADLEPDQKGIPVLIRQYLKLGAKFLAFNVDRDFGDCLDGLIVVDLVRTEPRVLERYMTKAGYADFMASHRAGGVEVASA